MKSRNRFVASLIFGISAALAVLSLGINVVYVVLVAWDVAAFVYLVTTWLEIWPMDGGATAKHAIREDTSRGLFDGLVLFASVVSLGAVALALIESARQSGLDQSYGVALAVFSVLTSWFIVHVLFMLRYAKEYYLKPVGGVDFIGTKSPSYHDFAYLAFTMGMTFQTSDTSLTTTKFRRIALRHALLSYVFGAVIVASTINLIIGLGSS